MNILVLVRKTWLRKKHGFYLAVLKSILQSLPLKKALSRFSSPRQTGSAFSPLATQGEVITGFVSPVFGHRNSVAACGQLVRIHSQHGKSHFSVSLVAWKETTFTPVFQGALTAETRPCIIPGTQVGQSLLFPSIRERRKPIARTPVMETILVRKDPR